MFETCYLAPTNQTCCTLLAYDPLKRHEHGPLGCVQNKAGNWAPPNCASQRMFSGVPHASTPCGVTSSCCLPIPWASQAPLPRFPFFVVRRSFKTVSVLVEVHFGSLPSTAAKRNKGGHPSGNNMSVCFSVASVSSRRTRTPFQHVGLFVLFLEYKRMQHKTISLVYFFASTLFGQRKVSPCCSDSAVAYKLHVPSVCP